MNSLQPNPQTPGGDQVSRGSGRKITPVRSWRKHALIGIVVFFVVTLLGTPIAWKKGKSTYQSEAVVVVSPRFLKNLEDDKELELQSNTQYREFVQQNVRTIDRYDIIEEAVKRLGASQYPWQKPHEELPRAVARLRTALSIVPVPDTYQITVTMDGDHDRGLAETVNTVVAVFLEKSKGEEFYNHDQRTASLGEDGERLSALIASEAKEKNQLAQQLGVSVFGENLVNPFDRLLVESKEALAAARQKRIVAESEFVAMEAQQDGEGSSAFHASGVDLAQKSPALLTLQANLNLRRTELMAKLSGMLPTHPGRPQMEKEIHDIDQVLKTRGDTLAQDYSGMLLTQRRAEVNGATRAEQLLQKEVDAQSQQAASYSGNYQKGLYISHEMERARKRREAIDDRLNFIVLEGQAPGFAHIFSPARKPLDPVRGGRKNLLLIVLMSGVILGLAIPLVIDTLDQRILSPDEAEQRMGFSPLGFTCAENRKPLGQARDRVRRIAAAIERENLRNESRSFLFIPVNSAVNTASLIDDISAELIHLGHTVQVAGKTELAPAVQAASAAAGADTVTTLCSRHGAASFGAVRKEVTQAVTAADFVLVATPPLAEGAETELLASTCDVVILTLAAAMTTRAELIAATRTLERIQPKAVSMIVTGYDPDPPMPPLNLIAQLHALRPSAADKGQR